MRLTFLGAAGTVTGSKYLLELDTQRVLIDCGLFQGLKGLRERNWRSLPFEPKSLDAVVLTHAHLDHSGYLPVLARQGFSGPIYCTGATRELLGLLLPDSARLQEEEAEFANRRRFSKHSPALPLYTSEDARRVLQQLRPVDWSEGSEVVRGVTVRFSPAGHLLGAASVLVESTAGRIVFSGDLGRPDDLLMRAAAPPLDAEWMVVESTYGDRLHEVVDVSAELAGALTRVIQRGGVTVIPSFAVGRAQLLLYLISRLKASGAIADVPVFLNSPMATDVTQIYHTYRTEHRLSEQECKAMCTAARFVNTVEESKRLNTLTGPMIIVSASGMATGGRVLHHLKAFAPDVRNMILFSGYQAVGTRGASLVGGADSVKIHGEWVPVRAEVEQLRGTSGHADARQIVEWLKQAAVLPQGLFVTHGEPAASDALRQRIRRELNLPVTVPEHGQTVLLERAAAGSRERLKG